MSQQSLMAIGIASVLVAAVVGGIVVSTRKHRVELTGDVLKVRSHPRDPEHTVALLDFRVHNPSTRQFMVHQIEVFVEEADGKSTPAEVFSEIDAGRVIDYYRVLGKKHNPGLVFRDRVDSGQTLDRSILISVPMSDERLQARKGLRIVVYDTDGSKTEIVEQRK